MTDTRALYEQVILDHTKNPRNFKALEHCDHTLEGYNPLCGDQFTIYVKMDGDVIADIAFEGHGCAISKASASLMTATLKGKTVEEAKQIFESFHAMVTSDPEAPIDEEAVGKLRVFGGVREYPIRIKCATLAWHTLNAALSGGHDSVSTE